MEEMMGTTTWARREAGQGQDGRECGRECGREGQCGRAHSPLSASRSPSLRPLQRMSSTHVHSADCDHHEEEKEEEEEVPQRRIFGTEDMAEFVASAAHAELLGFVVALSASVEGRANNTAAAAAAGEGTESQAVRAVVDVLAELDGWVDLHPAHAVKSRFGNHAFREWLTHVETVCCARPFLPPFRQPAFPPTLPPSHPPTRPPTRPLAKPPALPQTRSGRTGVAGAVRACGVRHRGRALPRQQLWQQAAHRLRHRARGPLYGLSVRGGRLVSALARARPAD